MNVIITCHLLKGSDIVYASVRNADELLISATLEYCIDACKERGYVIENALEVLYWLNHNCEFKGFYE